jgi:ATP-dependent 26S proteasome regulatory subunit
MLMELSSFDGVVLFATNLISNYDPAFRRRILDHIEFPLPDAAARGRILDHHTPVRVPGRQALDFAHLGELSDTLSGGELANVAYQACLSLLARLETTDGATNEATDGATGGLISEADFAEAITSAKRSRKLLPDRTPESPVLTRLTPLREPGKEGRNGSGGVLPG